MVGSFSMYLYRPALRNGINLNVLSNVLVLQCLCRKMYCYETHHPWENLQKETATKLYRAILEQHLDFSYRNNMNFSLFQIITFASQV